MITRRASTATSRADYVHIVLPRTEQRRAEGEKCPHTVYLVRLLSHLGEYPSSDSWYELRYSRVAELHTTLREEHPHRLPHRGRHPLPGLPLPFQRPHLR